MSLEDTLLKQVKTNSFPRFSILVGERGSGRKTLAYKLAKHLSTTIIEVDTKVDSIRDMINMSYTLVDTTVYLILNADTMSEGAKNAMLKVCEEPPNKAYFIMTLLDINNTLPTIKSRGSVYAMDNIDEVTLQDYYRQLNPMATRAQLNKVVDLCTTYGQVEIVNKLGVEEFHDYVNLVINNIHRVSSSNSFKIGIRMAFNGEEDKYPLDIFWNAFKRICLSRMKENPIQYAYGIVVTNKYMQDIKNPSINKQSTFDMWILDIRGEWLDYAKDN